MVDIYIRTYDDGELHDRLVEQARVVGMSLQDYCLEVLKDSLYPHDDLVVALQDRALEIVSRRKYARQGLFPGERRIL